MIAPADKVDSAVIKATATVSLTGVSLPNSVEAWVLAMGEPVSPKTAHGKSLGADVGGA